MPSTNGKAPYQVFIDFDNTISVGDVLDSVIEAFSPGDAWRSLEEAWAAGRIPTRACLDGQLRGIRATRAQIEDHLARVQLDPGLGELLEAVRADGAEITIVSDNFDAFLEPVLARHGLSGLACLSNHAEYASGGVLPSFPHYNPDCPGCAHCKKTHFVPRRDDREVIYIGDGLSDVCPSLHADRVFAKDSLLRRIQGKVSRCIPFTGLAQVAGLLPSKP
jgi:2-hydroxy-3-keto-5-methylthiopentenyl-1-phosphate phosphatase